MFDLYPDWIVRQNTEWAVVYASCWKPRNSFFFSPRPRTSPPPPDFSSIFRPTHYTQRESENDIVLHANSKRQLIDVTVVRRVCSTGGRCV